jgi:hypothetical protein
MMFRFSIRDVLWLTVVVGLAVGWWQATAKHRAVVKYNYHHLDRINASGVWVDYWDNRQVLHIDIDHRDGRLQIAPVTTP